MANEKLEVARELLAAAHYDDALSRAYYAMFHSAKAVLLVIDIDPRTHTGVISQFSQHFVKTNRVERKYGRLLSRAMQARETSDYNPIRRASVTEAEQAILNAESFVQKMKDLVSDLSGKTGSA